MENKKVYKQEITPISTQDCFVVFDRKKLVVDFPIHYHSEYELNCIKNAKGLQRLVDKNVEETEYWELLLTGPNVIHGWIQKPDFTPPAEELTLQMHANLFENLLQDKTAFKELKSLFSLSNYGIVFCQKTAEKVFEKLKKLAKSSGLESIILLQEILLILISDSNKRMLNTHKTLVHKTDNFQNDRLYSYIQQNYNKNITLEDMANLFNMSLSTFNRMIKKQTGTTFITFLNEYRLGMVVRKLLETDFTVQYIANSCGFHNLSHFNKYFKKMHGYTPYEYREINKGELSVK